METSNTLHRQRNKALGVPELIAIALGGMVGGGIFTILGISAEMIGIYTPIAIALGGALATLAAYSYVKLGVYYKEEGATYSFMKRVYPDHPFAASVIGWWVVFGYISTIALYAYTFSSYAISGLCYVALYSTVGFHVSVRRHTETCPMDRGSATPNPLGAIDPRYYVKRR